MKDDGTMARGKDLFIFAKKHNLRIAKIEDLISYRLKKEKLVKLKKNLEIKIQDQNFKLKIFENKINGSEHLAFTKGKLGSKIVPKVRVISSNLLLENILIGGKLPDTFNKTMKYFKKFKNCVLVFINENNLSLNNVSFKSNKVVSK
jgi:3,4-dihydroxy 2-butanone 4-phosphate synthase/GTP cyclohydrolase II